MSWVEVVRGGVVESRHRVNVVVMGSDGRIRAVAGDPERLTYYRSAAKPFQALPLVEDGVVDRFGLTAEELALCCGSHEGEPGHVAGVRSVLRRTGVEEGALRCGAHPPFSTRACAEIAARGEGAAPVHNNCSGKHAGMLALCSRHGWDPNAYDRADHPVQRRMLAEVERWAGVPAGDVRIGVDGCGVPCFGVPLAAIARSYARFAAAAERGEEPARVVEAMTTRPWWVAGSGRACTRVMERIGGRVFVKLGAEGVYGGGVPAERLGFAVKVEDGSRRAVEVALLRVLEELGVLAAGDAEALAPVARPEVRNARGDVVGEVRPAFRLNRRV